MYPKIFDKTETEFSNNGFGFLSDVKKILVTEERNGGFYVEMEYPLNGVNSEYLKYDYIILVKPNPIDRPQPFRIYDTKKSKNNHSITVKANHVTFDDSQNFLVDFTRNKTTASTVLTQMRENRTSKNKITYSTDITTPITVDWSKRSPVNALAGEQGSFIQTLNSEIKRDMWSVTANASRGRQSSFVARDEKGLTDFDFEEDVSGVVTKIYPFKTYKPEGSDEDKTITLKEKFITSKNADKYPFEKIAYLDLSQDETVTDEDSLRKVAQKQFTQEHIDLPKISGTLKIINLSKNPEYYFIGELSSVLLCDYIWCVSKTIKEKVQVQVNKVVYNPIIEDYDSLDVGIKKQSLGQSIANSINKVQNEVNKVQNQVNNIVISADGTKSFYSDSAPTEPEYDLNDGDIWFQPLADGSINSWAWNDTQKIWQPIFNKEDFDSAFNDVNSGVDAAKQQAQQASDKADQIVIDFNNQIGDIQTNLNGAKEDVASALSDAQKAIQQADFNNKEITEIKQKQDADGQRISTVEQNYNGLKQTVSDNAAKQESDRVQLSNLIQDKVSNGEFNSFKTQTSSQISSLVSNGGNLFPNAEFNDKNLSSYFNIVYRNATVETGIQANTKTGNYLKIQNTDLRYNTRLEVKGIIPASPGEKLNIAYDYLKNTNTSTPVVGFIARKRDGGDGWYYIRGEKTATDGKWKHIEQTWTVPQNVMGLTPIVMNLGNEDGVAGDYICFDNILITRTDITKTEVTQIQNGISSLAKDQNGLSQRLQTTEGIVDIVKNDVDGTKAQLNLLSDNINLKVDKDKVISQINVSPEEILIDGKKTHITNQTIIDNAVITSAMIKDVNADKITTGTLNAADVKIVNLDVSTLGGDYATFLKTAWRDSNSYSEITADGMKFYTKGTVAPWDRSSYLNIYSSQLTWKTSNKSWHYISQTTDSQYRNTLCLAGVTNGDQFPASISLRVDGYDTLTSISKNSHYGGNFVFIGQLRGQTYSKNQYKAEDEIMDAKDQIAGRTIDSDAGVTTYGIRLSAQNDICLNMTKSEPGKSIRFSSGIGSVVNKESETMLTFNKDNSFGMFIVSKPTYNRTYSSSANLFITENGYIGRTTSAKKYKQDIEYIDNIDEAKRTLDIQPAEWADKKQMMSHARSRAGISNPEDEERLARRYIGFIADDFADAGFEKLIVRDKTGAVEEFQYNRLSVYHHQMIKDLYRQIDTLKNEIKELKGDN